MKYIQWDFVRLGGRLKEVIRPEVDDFRVRDMETRRATLCTEDSVEPIKLTPQILEDNGWINSTYNGRTLYKLELNCYSDLVIEFSAKDEEDTSCGILTDGLKDDKVISYFPTEMN